tara:strand:+ start:157 stop:384 length:228 start_codon:yes stop_codon:yes gene_type:complete
MTKGFEAEVNLEETPNLKVTAEKPLKSNNIHNNRVDINVLKARAKKIEDKQNIKNIIVIIFFLMAIGSAGIYFSI